MPPARLGLVSCSAASVAAEDGAAASVGSSAVLLRRCDGGCGKFERRCSVVLLWHCSCPAQVLLQQLRRGWFCAGSFVGEGTGWRRSPLESVYACSRAHREHSGVLTQAWAGMTFIKTCEALSIIDPCAKHLRRGCNVINYQRVSGDC